MTKNGCELEWYLKPSINFNGLAKIPSDFSDPVSIAFVSR